MLDAFPRRRGSLADRESAEGAPREIEGGNLLRVSLAKVAMQPTLDDPEKRAWAAPVPFPLGLAPRGPESGARDGLLVARTIRLRGQALVEAHEHVASELELDARGTLR